MSVEVEGVLMYGIYDSYNELKLSNEQIDILYDRKDLGYWDDCYCGDWQAIGIYIHATDEWKDGPFKLDLTRDYQKEFDELCKKYNIVIPDKFKDKVGMYHFLYYY